MTNVILTWLRKHAVAALLIWTACAGLYGASHASMTTDEGIHVASGDLSLTRCDTRFDPEHPFLIKYVTALPLVLLQPALPPNDQLLWDRAGSTFYDAWGEARQWTEEWFYSSGNDADLMIFLARLPAVGIL